MKKISEAFADAWGVPKDVIMNIPRITISGDREIYIEHHKGISGYSENVIRVRAGMGTVVIEGKNLKITAVRQEDILVSGQFVKINYEV